MMSPAGWQHGDIASTIHVRLATFIDAHMLGKSFSAETGFILSRDPDTVRAPDFAFIAKENLPAKPPTEAYWPGAPDLAVEVLSPDDRPGYVNEKIRAWFAAGAQEVWIVDPKLKSVAIHRSASEVTEYTVGDTIAGSEQLLPGFSCPVVEMFSSFTS